jgi:Tfx family DNA-binding protein
LNDKMKAEENTEGEEEEQDDGAESLLTERQLQVLQLRKVGRSQQEIADVLGTTRSNISILEKRAHQNIHRAEQTLRQWMMIKAPISLKVKEGTDVFDLPKMIFDAADQRSIELPVTSLDIIVQLRRKSPQLFRKRAILKDIDVYVTEDGELLVQESSPYGSLG